MACCSRGSGRDVALGRPTRGGGHGRRRPTFARVFEIAARMFARVPPVVAIAGAWFVGTLVVHSLAALPSAGVYVPLGIGALLALRWRPTRWVAWGIAGFAWTAISAQQRLDDRLAPADNGRDVEISGYV